MASATSTSTTTTGNKVCVVGGGAFGLVGLKNLLEQGLDVVTFERNGYVGGTWHATLDPTQTSALSVTISITSKQGNAFTDFPFREDCPTFPTAKDFEEYLELYTDHFNLRPHIRLSTTVVKVERDEARRKWIIFTRPTSAAPSDSPPLDRHEFDRIVLATGAFSRPKMLKIKGVDKFQGDVLHAIGFKDPAPYKGQNVLLMGAGNTALDLVSFLDHAGANKIYMSHRAFIHMISRFSDGRAFDWAITRRVSGFLRAISAVSGHLLLYLLTLGAAQSQAKDFPKLLNHPSFTPDRKRDPILQRLPLVGDALARYMESGRVTTVQGVSQISGPKSVLLTDGTTLTDIDSIIFCTGYKYDFSLVPPEADPTNPALAPDGFKAFRSTPYYDQADAFARLYHGFLSVAYPDSLAFIGHTLSIRPAFPYNDLLTMALAQLWSGGWPLPSRREMDREVDRQYRFVCRRLHYAAISHPGMRVNGPGSYYWINRVAGTGVMERLGLWWSWEAWKLWLRDRRFYGLLMDGLDSPFVYRLFDETGRTRARKRWDGAAEAIEKANRQANEVTEQWNREHKGETTKKNKGD